ncbi:GNAT family N-acetyltransferase [Yoonia litorea]|uniref:Putative acetyltransferase n=1 Tax=Yoonia litorea TaxID=1123755 RepID=A0A1I6N1U1_9RHOB|nr:N-acetyltransferase [Yoonia litorea]SFS21919.1 putative acetyltransferase [Yoonia litorea]
MNGGPDFARELRAGEEDQVDALLQAAFGGQEEATLVRRLRKARCMAGETVQTWDGEIIGYYALSSMVRPKGWLCLAPVAIKPELQGHGYGKRMIGFLSEWARLTKTPVVVLGDPAFYERAGFSRAKATQLSSPYPIDHTMLAGMDQPAKPQALVYPAPFGAP